MIRINRAASSDGDQFACGPSSGRRISGQPPAWRREIEPVWAPRSAAGHEDDVAPIRPDPQVGPEANALNLQSEFGDSPLCDIELAALEGLAQPRPPDRGGVEQSAARKPMRRPEDKLAIS